MRGKRRMRQSGLRRGSSTYTCQHTWQAQAQQLTLYPLDKVRRTMAQSPALPPTPQTVGVDTLRQALHATLEGKDLNVISLKAVREAVSVISPLILLLPFTCLRHVALPFLFSHSSPFSLSFSFSSLSLPLCLSFSLSLSLSFSLSSLLVAPSSSPSLHCFP